MRRILVLAPLIILATLVGFVYPPLGSPSSPTPLRVPNRAVIAYDNKTGTTLFDRSEAHHGYGCEGPEVSHTVVNQPDRVFICRDHWMTNAYSVGTGAVYIVLDHMMDISNGQTSTLHWNMSTYRSSSRDWVDFDIQPQETMLLVNGQNGTSLRDGIHGSTDSQGPFYSNPGNSHFGVQVYRDWDHDTFPQADSRPWERVVPDNSFPTAAVQRQSFDVILSKTHIRVGMPTYNLWWVDADINPPLDWDYGVVSLNHRSYNAGKACPDPAIQGPCGADTWHWGGEEVTPSVPFTMIHSPNLYARQSEPTVRFDSPVPAGSSLFLAAVSNTQAGHQLQVSLDQGRTWRDMSRLAQCESCYLGDEWHKNYRLDNLPGGLQEIRLRSADGAANWTARDFEVFAFSQPPGGSGGNPTPLPSATPVLPTPTATETSTPLPASPTVSPTAAPTGVPTSAPTATPEPTVTPTVPCFDATIVGTTDPPVIVRGAPVPCP